MTTRGRRILAVAVAVLAAAAVSGAAGYEGGHLAADRAAASTTARARSEVAQAERDLSASMSYDAQAQAAAASALAGASGICWAARGGIVVAIAAPLKRPGGETCPRGAPRYSPVEPEPTAAGATGAPGG